MNVVYSDRYDAVQIGHAFTPWGFSVPNGWYPPYWANDWQPGYKRDELFKQCLLDVPAGWVSVYDYVGWANPEDRLKLTLGRFKPRAIRSYSAGDDFSRYGSLLAGFLNMGNPLSLPSHPSWSRETDVYHKSSEGVLQLPQADRRLWSATEVTYRYGVPLQRYVKGIGIPTVYKYYRTLDYDVVDDLPTFAVDYMTTIGGYVPFEDRRFWFPDICELIDPDDLFITEEVRGYAHNKLSWTNFKMSSTIEDVGENHVLSYSFGNEATSSVSSASRFDGYDVRIEASIWFENTDGYTPVPAPPYKVKGRSICGFFVTRTYTHTNGSGTALPSGYPWVVDGGVDNADILDTYGDGWEPHVLAVPGSQYSKPSDQFWNKPAYISASYGINRPHQALAQYVQNNLDALRPSCALSANDCLSDVTSDLNGLESLPELVPMLKQIRDVTKLASVVKKLAVGDLSVLKDLIDLFASGYLAYKYGAKPLASDVQEARRIANTYVGNLHHISTDLPPALYGSFKFKLPDQIPGIPGTLVLTTRTKMVLGSGPGAIMAAVLTLNDVGLLPTLARIWDLVPFSFVLDWFTNLGDRFEAIDSGVLRVALNPRYYIHTFTVECFPETRFLDPFVRRSGSVEPQFRYFVRERTRFETALPMSGKYDFLGGTTPERQGLSAGCLLWVTAS